MENLLVETSGGRSSGFMAYMLKNTYGSRYEQVRVFANTGFENEATLEFVRDCDKDFGFDTVWVEAVFNEGGKGTTHKIVTFETASRRGEPYIEMCKKYGLPNHVYKHCTRELKLAPIHDYVKSIGWKKGEYKTAIGIRVDEPKRYKKEINKTKELFDDIALKPKKECWQKVVHPMVSMFPVSKYEVLDWWSGQDFDLQLQEHQGNCKTCFKKSTPKLFKLMDEDISQFEFTAMLESEFGHIGKNKIKHNGKAFYSKKPRVMYRGYQSTEDLIATFKVGGNRMYNPDVDESSCGSDECGTSEHLDFELVS
jgi:3'-phosphoadenosine 5'-phosphosulfate sulfotransferase (PAPS reductase)/FAD synthetase